MKKVKFLVNTAYQGPRKEGDVVSVPDDFASRWVKNGIAAFIDGKEESASEPVPESVPEPESDTTQETDFTQLSAKELYSLCKEKGLDIEKLSEA